MDMYIFKVTLFIKQANYEYNPGIFTPPPRITNAGKRPLMEKAVRAVGAFTGLGLIKLHLHIDTYI